MIEQFMANYVIDIAMARHGKKQIELAKMLVDPNVSGMKLPVFGFDAS